MTQQTYEVVQHDEGWAYKVGDVYSETFPTHDAAREAAEAAARRQEQLRSDPAVIEYEDVDGEWHREVASGDDHPQTDVEDETAGAR